MGLDGHRKESDKTRFFGGRGCVFWRNALTQHYLIISGKKIKNKIKKFAT